jgi:hypothetical protein
MKTGLEPCVWIPSDLSASLIQDSKWKFRASVVTRLNPLEGWLSLFLLPLFLVCNSSALVDTGSAPTRAHKNGAEFTTYRWNYSAGAPANPEISSIKPNDACWEQHVRLIPGWYYFTAEIRALYVGTGGAGACLSLLDHVFTTNWQRVGFLSKPARRMIAPTSHVAFSDLVR